MQVWQSTLTGKGVCYLTGAPNQLNRRNNLDVFALFLLSSEG